MNTNPRQILLGLYKLFDLMIILLAFGFASYLTFSAISPISFVDFLSVRVKLQNFALMLVLLMVFHLILVGSGLYQSKRLTRRRQEAWEIIKACSWIILFMAGAGYAFQVDLITLPFLGVFWALSAWILIFTRLVQRAVLGWFRARGRNHRQALIIGTNQRAIQFAQSILGQQKLGYHVVGFVDESWEGLDTFHKANQQHIDSPFNLVTGFDGFREFIRQNVVDEVFVFLPVGAYYNRISQIVAHCEEQGVMVRMSTSIFNLKVGQTTIDELQEESVVTVSTGAMRGWSFLFKRVFDLVAASIIVILLSPVMLLTALMVKITSPGPVLFKQERVGLNKRKFHVYKFRSMVVDAEKRMAELEKLNEASGPVFKITRDPRITPIGEFIRKTSLDELPQLFNVIKGDMSLVGPRPLPIRDYSGFDTDWHRRRFSVRPGITCLWQVQGRSSIPFEKWMELDMQYIDQWSLALDLIILFKTIPAVLKGSGAA